jgi:hypothetical protein
MGKERNSKLGKARTSKNLLTSLRHFAILPFHGISADAPREAEKMGAKKGERPYFSGNFLF